MSAELSRGEDPGTPAGHDDAHDARQSPAVHGRASVPAQPDPAGPAGRRHTARQHPEPGGETRTDDRMDGMDAAQQAEQADPMEQQDQREQPERPGQPEPPERRDAPPEQQAEPAGPPSARQEAEPRSDGEADQEPDRGSDRESDREEQREAHDPHDRAGARALFVELSKLPEGSNERAELRNQLVRMHLPLVEHLARRFRNRGEPLDDLTQVATIGLIKSVDRFDVDRGVEFSTYATPTVVGEIKRHFRDKGWAVRVPRRLQELRLALTTATGELSQRHGRAPTVHELAEHLKISEEEVLEGLESANAYSTLSLDVPDTDDESPAVADTLGSEDEALEGVEYRESLKPLLEQLPPREKTILLLRFFGNMTQSQIAQEVGISQMHVSRLLARTLAQLRDKLLIEE
ncbi:SigB/SigF/SigG family RNA polymerase sigma factor [Streptomyces sp. NPDC008317]|uniref:SigB/SigF/SigG family RNA polymerase sigma factor n=1 Tax=Streptomyces sp. NPDC008317 TaxID=3364827 RepID=UPI0036E3417A